MEALQLGSALGTPGAVIIFLIVLHFRMKAAEEKQAQIISEMKQVKDFVKRAEELRKSLFETITNVESAFKEIKMDLSDLKKRVASLEQGHGGRITKVEGDVRSLVNRRGPL